MEVLHDYFIWIICLLFHLDIFAFYYLLTLTLKKES